MLFSLKHSHLLCIFNLKYSFTLPEQIKCKIVFNPNNTFRKLFAGKVNYIGSGGRHLRADVRAANFVEKQRSGGISTMQNAICISKRFYIICRAHACRASNQIVTYAAAGAWAFTSRGGFKGQISKGCVRAARARSEPGRSFAYAADLSTILQPSPGRPERNRPELNSFCSLLVSKEPSSVWGHTAACALSQATLVSAEYCGLSVVSALLAASLFQLTSSFQRRFCIQFGCSRWLLH